MEGEGCNVFGVPTVIDYGIGAGAGAGAYLWGRRTVGRSVYGHVFTKFSPMGSLPHFLTNDAPPRARDPLKKLYPFIGHHHHHHLRFHHHHRRRHYHYNYLSQFVDLYFSMILPLYYFVFIFSLFACLLSIFF